MKKVMIVDDSETVRQQVRNALAPAGYQIVEAVDGIDGLEKLRSTPDLALVLCDVLMPNMSGLELLASAQSEGFSKPIVMLTSEGQPSLIKRARQMGAKGWLVKPFKVEALIAAVDRLTSL